MPMKYTTTQLVEALRYCVDAQRATSGEACRSCKAAELFECDPLKACSLLNEVAADCIEAMEADMQQHALDQCEACIHNIPLFEDGPACDLECGTCKNRCVCSQCTDYDKFEWRGLQKEEHDGH